MEARILGEVADDDLATKSDCDVTPCDTVCMCVGVCADLKSRGWLCLTASPSSLVFGDGHLEVGALEGLQVQCSITQRFYPECIADKHSEAVDR